jgi:hypothetical protein
MVLAGVVLYGLAGMLGACATSTGPLYGPSSPRNSIGEVVDPQTGVVIPGYPQGGEG